MAKVLDVLVMAILGILAWEALFGKSNLERIRDYESAKKLD